MGLNRTRTIDRFERIQAHHLSHRTRLRRVRCLNGGLKWTRTIDRLV